MGCGGSKVGGVAKTPMIPLKAEETADDADITMLKGKAEGERPITASTTEDAGEAFGRVDSFDEVASFGTPSEGEGEREGEETSEIKSPKKARGGKGAHHGHDPTPPPTRSNVWVPLFDLQPSAAASGIAKAGGEALSTLPSAPDAASETQNQVKTFLPESSPAAPGLGSAITSPTRVVTKSVVTNAIVSELEAMGMGGSLSPGKDEDECDVEVLDVCDESEGDGFVPGQVEDIVETLMV